MVGRAGNGVDNIDVQECTRRGITVVNTPEGNTMAAAEMSVALVYSVFRNIPQAYHAAKNKDFRRNKFVGEELDGKIAAVIGLGKIGSIVAKKLIGAGIRVVAYDHIYIRRKSCFLGITRIENLDDLIKMADLITIHIPKTPESKNLIGERELALCKKAFAL